MNIFVIVYFVKILLYRNWRSVYGISKIKVGII